jgi:hypothetical protein
MLRTFDDWSSRGYKIIKGSKAKWVDGVPMFSRSQVTKTATKKRKGKRDYFSGLDHDEISDWTGDSFI